MVFNLNYSKLSMNGIAKPTRYNYGGHIHISENAFERI